MCISRELIRKLLGSEAEAGAKVFLISKFVRIHILHTSAGLRIGPMYMLFLESLEFVFDKLNVLYFELFISDIELFILKWTLPYPILGFLFTIYLLWIYVLPGNVNNKYNII